MPVARRIRRRGWIKSDSKDCSRGRSTRALVPVRAVRSADLQHRFDAPAFVFDVEGTLIDSVLPSLNCWRDAFAQFGFKIGTADILRRSHERAAAMIGQLLPYEPEEVREKIHAVYAARYRAEVLPGLRPLRGVTELFADLKRRNKKVVLSANCAAEELAEHRRRLQVDGHVDAMLACGDEIADTDSRAQSIRTALERLGVSNPADAIFVADTPGDAEMAGGMRTRVIGVLTGHFPRADLLAAGCFAVFSDPKSMHEALQHHLPAAA